MSHDPATDLNKALEAAITDLQADLVVMATHVPNIRLHLGRSRRPCCNAAAPHRCSWYAID